MTLSVAFPETDQKNPPQISPGQLWCWKRRRAAVRMFPRPGTWDDDRRDSTPGGQSSGFLSASCSCTDGATPLDHGYGYNAFPNNFFFLSWIENVYKGLPISGITPTYKYKISSLKILNWIWTGYHPYRLSPTISWNLQALSHRTNCSHSTTMINKQIRGVLNTPVDSSITLCTKTVTKTLIKLMHTVAEWPHMLLAYVSISRITSPQVQANRSPKRTKNGEVTQRKLILKYYGDRIIRHPCYMSPRGITKYFADSAAKFQLINAADSSKANSHHPCRHISYWQKRRKCRRHISGQQTR